MSSKSRHGRGKHSSGGKRRKSRQRFSATVAQQVIMAQTDEPVSRPNASAPSVSMPTPMAKSVVVHYPFITTELRSIGVLAGIMLVILSVLALVLS